VDCSVVENDLLTIEWERAKWSELISHKKCESTNFNMRVKWAALIKEEM
jgi:hypothetical protein